MNIRYSSKILLVTILLSFLPPAYSETDQPRVTTKLKIAATETKNAVVHTGNALFEKAKDGINQAKHTAEDVIEHAKLARHERRAKISADRATREVKEAGNVLTRKLSDARKQSKKSVEIQTALDALEKAETAVHNARQQLLASC